MIYDEVTAASNLELFIRYKDSSTLNWLASYLMTPAGFFTAGFFYSMVLYSAGFVNRGATIKTSGYRHVRHVLTDPDQALPLLQIPSTG